MTSERSRLQQLMQSKPPILTTEQKNRVRALLITGSILLLVVLASFIWRLPEEFLIRCAGIGMGLGCLFQAFLIWQGLDARQHRISLDQQEQLPLAVDQPMTPSTQKIRQTESGEKRNGPRDFQ